MTLAIDNDANAFQSDADLSLTPGDGCNVEIDGCTWPSTSGGDGTVLVTDASGVLSWQIRSGQIVVDREYYISTAGSDVTGDGTSSYPWATLGRALELLRGYRIASNATVTLILSDGAYTVSTPFVLDLPDGQQVKITGQNAYTKLMSSVQSSSGSSGTWAIVINLNNVSNIAVGDYVLITGASGGSNPALMEGCHEVTDVDSGNSRITVASKARSASVPSDAVAATVKALKTRLVCSSVGFEMGAGASVQAIDKLVLVGPGTGVADSAGIRAGVSGALPATVSCNQHSLGIVNFAYGIWSYNGSVVLGEYVVISGCNVGVCAQVGGYAVINSGVVSGCGTGVYPLGDGVVNLVSTHVVGNDVGVYVLSNAYAYAVNTTFFGNATDCSPAVNTFGNNNSLITFA